MPNLINYDFVKKKNEVSDFSSSKKFKKQPKTALLSQEEVDERILYINEEGYRITTGHPHYVGDCLQRKVTPVIKVKGIAIPVPLARNVNYILYTHLLNKTEEFNIVDQSDKAVRRLLSSDGYPGWTGGHVIHPDMVDLIMNCESWRVYFRKVCDNLNGKIRRK